MGHAAGFLNPVGVFMGLDGIIILAYIIALPANEIIAPTIIMGYMAAGKRLEVSNDNLAILFTHNGWTLLTPVCVMLFPLLHYPCTTTTWTIWREMRSVKWTVIANVLPLMLAILVCAAVAHTVPWIVWPLTAWQYPHHRQCQRHDIGHCTYLLHCSMSGRQGD